MLDIQDSTPAIASAFVLTLTLRPGQPIRATKRHHVRMSFEQPRARVQAALLLSLTSPSRLPARVAHRLR